jgi:hypothetical protein
MIPALYLHDTRGASVVTIGRTARRRKTSGGGSRGGGKKFVAIDLGGNAKAPFGNRLDAYDLAAAADVDVAGLRDLLRQRNHELNFTANLERLLGKEVESLITDVSGLCAQLGTAGFAWKNPEREAHRESPSYTAFGNVAHQISWSGEPE